MVLEYFKSCGVSNFEITSQIIRLYLTLFSTVLSSIPSLCSKSAIYFQEYRDEILDRYNNLIQKGCVLSEYLPYINASANLFPPRNRIISGLSDALLVVEAKEKSGTLITVEMALEQGKEVYVVPGRITDTLSKGCNRLILEGANPVISPSKMLEDLYKNIKELKSSFFSTKVYITS